MPKLQMSKGWVIHRVLALPDRASTRQVRDALKLGERTLRYWLSNVYFRSANIAELVNGKWYWNRERLLPWVIIAFKIKSRSNMTITMDDEQARAYGYAQNPQTDEGLSMIPIPSIEMARRVLGIPENYLIRSGRQASAYLRPVNDELPEEIPE